MKYPGKKVGGALAAVVAGLVLGAGAAFGVAAWLPRERLGWFELEGVPVRLDGRAVEDWRHVNDVLAKPTPEFVEKMLRAWDPPSNPEQWTPPPKELLERVFEVEYRPAPESTEVRKATVQRYLPTLLQSGGRMHPAAYARHVVVATETVK